MAALPEEAIVTAPSEPTTEAPKTRSCLRCRTKFTSAWSGERICSRCKSSHGWRQALPLSVGRESK